MKANSKTLPNGVEVEDRNAPVVAFVDWICEEIVRQERERRRPKAKA